jgi:hypothetical protein
LHRASQWPTRPRPRRAGPFSCRLFAGADESDSLKRSAGPGPRNSPPSAARLRERHVILLGPAVRRGAFFVGRRSRPGPGGTWSGPFFTLAPLRVGPENGSQGRPPKLGGGVMSSKRVQPASECQACGGTGYVAGAQPIKTGPYVLEPPPCPVCGGRGRAPQPKE